MSKQYKLYTVVNGVMVENTLTPALIKALNAVAVATYDMETHPVYIYDNTGRAYYVPCLFDSSRRGSCAPLTTWYDLADRPSSPMLTCRGKMGRLPGRKNPKNQRKKPLSAPFCDFSKKDFLRLPKKFETRA